jgi:hypothetical protein
MQSIDIVLSTAPGSGDIDLSEVVVHWLGPNGSSELTDSTFSITPIKSSGTVIEARSDRFRISNFGKTIPDGTPATVRFITADGGTTTVILRAPNAPPSDGDVSLLWQSPSGNPASGSGTATPTATATATATATPSEPSSSVEWTYSDHSFKYLVAKHNGPLYTISYTSSPRHYFFEEIDAADGSSLKESEKFSDSYWHIDMYDQDRPVARNSSSEDVVRWDPDTNSTSTVFDWGGDGWGVADIGTYNGDIYLAKTGSNGQIERRQTDGTVVWEESNSNDAPGYLEVTDSAVYYDDGNTLIKRDHNGNLEWSTDIGNSFTEIDASSADYVYIDAYIDYESKIRQLNKSDGSMTSFSYTSGTTYSIDTDQDGYVYVHADPNLTILDPADASVVYTREFSDPGEFRVRSDGVYMRSTDTVTKITISNLP